MRLAELDPRTASPSKNKDICIVRYAEDGELLWEKTYGGSGDDYAASVTVSPYATNYTEDSDRNWDVEVTETGFVLTGTAASDDGVFSSSKTESGVSKAFFMKIDPEGNMETLTCWKTQSEAQASLCLQSMTAI